MMKTKFLLLLLPLSLLFFSSCSNHQAQIIEESTSFRINEKLDHVQYWNKNDNWDFQSLKVTFYKNDTPIYSSPFSDINISYKTNPVSPDGLLANNYVLTMYDISYQLSNGTILYHENIEFEINIVDYPYISSISDNTPLLLLEVVGLFVCVFIIAICFESSKK